MAIDRTVKFTVRLNMLNPAHVTINKVLNELNLDIFKSKNQFFIDAATYYIENYGQEELTQPKKEKEPEFVSTEDMEAIEERIRQEGLKSIESNSIDGISVLTGCIGWDMGNVAMCNSRCATNQQINAIIDFNHKLVDPRYVYYWLKGKKDYLFSIASVTRTPILSKSVFENIDIPLPSLKIQERVTKLLSLIDEKIRKNHQINDYLAPQSSMVA